jgi:hypothetical protein
MIHVRQISHNDPLEFDIEIREPDGTTRHRVIKEDAYYERLTKKVFSESRFIEATFQFLLDREPREAILESFDVSIISRYFPEFERRISDYLK